MTDKHVITLEVDRSRMFDAVAAVGDGGQSVGTCLAGVLLGGPDFFDAVKLAAYGVSILPNQEPAA